MKHKMETSQVRGYANTLRELWHSEQFIQYANVISVMHQNYDENSVSGVLGYLKDTM